MKPSELKQNLKQLKFDECKYYEIQTFLYSNRTPLKAIVKINLIDKCLLLHLDGGMIVEC